MFISILPTKTEDSNGKMTMHCQGLKPDNYEIFDRVMKPQLRTSLIAFQFN